MLFVLVFVIVLLSIAMMALGYVLQKKEIKGTCGGLASYKGSTSQVGSDPVECMRCGKKLV